MPANSLPVGNYTVTFNYSGDLNYNAAAGVVTLTVKPAPLTEKVNSATRPFGPPTQSSPASSAASPPAKTILVAYSTTATATSPVGNYPISAALTTVGPASLSNYAIANTPGTLTITQGSSARLLPMFLNPSITSPWPASKRWKTN